MKFNSKFIHSNEMYNILWKFDWILKIRCYTKLFYSFSGNHMYTHKSGADCLQSVNVKMLPEVNVHTKFGSIFLQVLTSYNNQVLIFCNNQHFRTIFLSVLIKKGKWLFSLPRNSNIICSKCGDCSILWMYNVPQ